MSCLIPGKFLYLATPHTGSTSTVRAFLKHIPGAHNIGAPHISVEFLRYGDAELVTTLRDPYDLIATWYVRSKSDLPLHEWLPDYENPLHLREGLMYYHANPGVTLLRYENLEHSLNAFLSKYRLGPFKLGHVNKTPNKDPWRTYFDSEAYAAVRERFGPEIERVGYVVL